MCLHCKVRTIYNGRQFELMALR